MPAATSVSEGWVRDNNEGQEVTRLEYEAFQELAVKEGDRIIAEALRRFPIKHARCIHRVGSLNLGEMAVWVGVEFPRTAGRPSTPADSSSTMGEASRADLEEGILSERRFGLGELRTLRRAGAAFARATRHAASNAQ